MSKEVWCEAHEQLAHRLKREPTEDEIIDYISAREDSICDLVRENQRAVQVNKTFDLVSLQRKIL